MMLRQSGVGMSDKVLEGLSSFGLFGIFMAAIVLFRKGQVRTPYFFLSLAVFAIYQAAYEIGRRWDIPFFEPSAWNWSAKIYALAALLIIIAIVPVIDRQSVGLTLRRAQGAWQGWLAVIMLMAAFTFAAGQFPPERFDGDWDALAFQLTMPGLEEELFFRGLLLLLIDRTFETSSRVFGAPFGWGALLTSIMFGLAHGVGFSDGVFSFGLAHAGYTFLGALVLVWLRAKTGNLLAPVLVHSFGNSIFYVM